MANEKDDLNHLLLNCRMSSELAAGMRYAYYRLDTIDRKASEIFRTFLTLFGSLVGLNAILEIATPGASSDPLEGKIYGVGIVLLTIAVVMVVIHLRINRLHFHRIPVSECNEGSLVGELKVSGRHRRVLVHYLEDISKVTVKRENFLKWLGWLYIAGLAFSFAEGLMIVISAAD